MESLTVEKSSLTSPWIGDNLPFLREAACMKGGVYTKEKCPVCQGNFQNVKNDLLCPSHLTRPKHCFIQVYDKFSHKTVQVYTDPETRESFYSYEQAYQLLGKMRREIKAGNFEPSRYVAEKIKPLRFTIWSDKWYEVKRIEVQKRLRAPSYLKMLKVHLSKLKDFFKDMDIRDIGNRQINDFYLWLDGSPKYIKNIMDTFRKMLNDGFDWGDIKIMPKFPKIEMSESFIRTIDLDQQDMIINAIPDQMDRAFILFTARQMVRPSETRALFWDDLDLKHDRVIIQRHFSLNEIRETTKAKQVKILPLDGEVKKTLQCLPRHITSPFVFQKKGRAFSESWPRKLWNRTSKQLGVEISLYQGTRHSSATEAVNRVGVDSVQEFLHHTSRSMTKRYAKMNVNGLKRVLREK